ncbi:hypothetical protein VTN77DRAFT_5165 [Rasamsonia byssochlamydoides]|uniref:uncharacterized protein n=1 Tax=Rasamsonia byssochlamydoides TaxID=89139 RepID=UPI003742838D
MDDARRPRRRPSNLYTGPEESDLSEYPGGQGSDAASKSYDRFASSKVAIPRATITADQPSSTRRVGHACEACREQKTKCSGDRPTCKRCQDLGITCTYGDRKRERTAKQLRDLTRQVQDYELLLNTLLPRLNPEDMQLIEDTLARYRIEGEKSATNELPTLSSKSGVSDAAFGGNPVPTILTGLLGGIDYTEEDFNRNERSKAVGFVGKHSEMSWIYSLKREIEYEFSGPGSVPAVSPEDQERHSIASVSYFLDDVEIPIIEDIDPLGRPPQAVADELMNGYFNNVHPAFPIIRKETFMGQYKSFYSTPFVRPGRRWLAILNLIYAIAARYFRQIQTERAVTGDDDLVYFSRAWKLGMGESAILGHPDLQQVQVEGLSSFYLLSIGHINRSWRVCSMSIRSAIAMGLNLRSESTYVTNVSKETRYRVWWSLHTLETILCSMTGRPLSTRKEFCSTPLPVPFEEEEFADGKVTLILADNKVRSSLIGQFASRRPSEPAISGPTDTKAVRRGKELVNPNVSLYFLCFVDLDLIMREVIETLYAPGDARKSSRGVEAAITDLNSKADMWLSRLPSVFQFTAEQKSQAFERQRLNLALHFYSMKVLLCKVFLHHPDRQLAGSGTLDRFCDRISALCIDAACRMLDLFPDEPDVIWLHRVSPWWCVLHYLLQSATVLLIELSFRAKFRLQEPEEPLEKVRKASRWLREMSSRGLASQRAWSMWGELLSRLGPKLGSEVDVDTSEGGLLRRP